MSNEYFPNHERADTPRVVRRLAEAILKQEPCTFISMADGEAALLWAAKGFGQFHYLSAWGFSVEERVAVAEQLAAAIPQCDIVGLPRSGPMAKQPGMGPRLYEALQLWDIQLKPDALIGDALGCFYLMFDAWLWSLMEHRKVLVVTSEAPQVVASLNGRQPPPGLASYAGAGFWQHEIAFGITLEFGLEGSEKCLEEARNLEIKPDICLLGAGSRAAYLAVELAKMYNMPVIELGSVFAMLYLPSEPAKVFNWYQAEG